MTEPRLTAVLGALDAELAPLWERAHRATLHGIPAVHAVLAGAPVLVLETGVGKAAAAHAAAVAVAEGAARLLVVGTCGGLAPATPVGHVLHAARAVQWDLATRDGREATPDPDLAAAWRAVLPGSLALFLTADRPAVRLFERWRRRRALRRAGALPDDWVPAADMETAAIGAVAARAGVPWAACRVVSDAATWHGAGTFQRHLPLVGGQAAASVPALLGALLSRRDTGPAPDRAAGP